ncbi:hypothetical protein [Nitrosomonas sp.]|uniref:hypothetical protein n=1 Tax=Nitrosomonas sp. TaxID=42353 RepID=UPI0025E2E1CF|nr:hypothetical protein [Nitrosomonas sp.]MCC6916534.1 hypothetical protein [Nitrosomonas sp.]
MATDTQSSGVSGLVAKQTLARSCPHHGEPEAAALGVAQVQIVPVWWRQVSIPLKLGHRCLIDTVFLFIINILKMVQKKNGEMLQDASYKIGVYAIITTIINARVFQGRGISRYFELFCHACKSEL